MAKRWQYGKAVGLVAIGFALGATGVAAAAGTSFLLGQSNHESATSSLTSKGKDTTLALTSPHGVPLQLKSSATEPPFTVSSSKEVHGLNAALLDGEPASVFTGSHVVAWTFYNRDGLVPALTHGIKSISNPETGIYCLVPAAGVSANSIVMVTPEYEFSGGSGEETYDASGAPACTSGDIEVITQESASDTNAVAFELVVF
jgi:hypothetical protein